jgi:hypothetical membrane protein
MVASPSTPSQRAHSPQRWTAAPTYHGTLLQTDGRFARRLACDRNAIGTWEKVEGKVTAIAARQTAATRRLEAWAGVVGSLLFVSVFTIEGALRPGYDAASMYISALSMGPRGWIQIVNFMVFGALLLLFARGVAAEFGRTARVGVTLLILIGLSFIASGPFVMDPVSVAFTKMSLHSQLHYLFGAIVFSLAPVSCFVFFRRFGQAPTWRALRWWTLGLGIVMVVGIGFLKAAALPPANALHPWLGVIQRATIIPFFIFVLMFGLAMLKRVEVDA